MMSSDALPGAFDQPAEHVGTREGYERWASRYDAEDNPLVTLEEPIVRKRLGEVSGLHVADLGCGTGRHTEWLAQSGAHVTAVDFSTAMLERARRKPRCEIVRFVPHDLSMLPTPLASGGFDRVVSGLVLEHLSDTHGFFAEIARLLRPGGRAVVSVMHPAMWLAGVQARFIDPATGTKVLVGSHRQTISQYVNHTIAAGLAIEQFSEHCVDESLARRMPKAARYLGWPMALVMSSRTQPLD
jgi:malonyl-CoA O-methyltransferase